METKETADGIEASLHSKDSINWCNFCGFTSDNLDDYLMHSCIEVIDSTGQRKAPTDQATCA